MKAILILSVTFMACWPGGTAVNVDVPTDGRLINILPPQSGPSDTTWMLKTGIGSKMVLICLLEHRDCSQVNMIIWDGEKTLSVCDEYRPYVLNNSVRHEMAVRIVSRSSFFRPALCQVSATKPYIDMPEKQIDSSEHGMVKKKATTCKCGWANKDSSRIVGGVETKPNEYPFALILVHKYRMVPFCGGSIITPRHALTAAHCTHPFTGIPLSVVVGEHDITTMSDSNATDVIDVAKVLDHPLYDNITHLHDISVLFLVRAIRESKFVGPVCMPSVQRDLRDDYIKVMGWGLTAHEGYPSIVLRKVNLRVIDPDICKVIYQIDPVARTQICTYNNRKDSCQGDSGGPLVWPNPETNMYTQVAIVSYGKACASTDPGVNTDVAKYIDWIKAKIAATSPQELCY